MTGEINDKQDDLFERGRNLVEYVPCVEPPVENMDKQFFASQYMDVYRDVRKGNISPQQGSTAIKALDSLLKVTEIIAIKSKVTVNSNLNSNSGLTDDDMIKEAHRIANRLKGID